MTPRMNIFQTAAEGAQAMLAVETSIEKSGLEHGLLELVRLRVSQMNGCAFCIHMHARDAVKHGESEMRIHLLDGWRHSPAFTDRERAALNWAETLTNVAETQAPDADYEMLQAAFDETEIAYLTLLIGAINLWSRVQIGLRAVHPAEESKAAAA
ncbi:carboxymuconolactone decarboxylase family protein [Parasphingopyxis marina]|uniref:Carboxymuconolactone decarboxylase family protein n=1 Tax=Parasphingopyxis marina TaxID=2761622 RepID=A0A842I1V1_9SPHN|nr:carboxymuconolactone decarboxylase family protein [Parasphingopyxis marina]MBC2779155.1 carboxymuconolactone decarboxylase family protein [Parasphingopyxis marina]